MPASKNSLYYRITECNSIYGGGKPGASDVFAASYGRLILCGQWPKAKGRGVNFHGGKLVYSPITMSNGIVAASPVYYGMLAFKYGNAGGRILPTSVSQSSYNCSAYSCVNADNSLSVTLINKETTKNFAFNLQLSKAASSVQVIRAYRALCYISNRNPTCRQYSKSRRNF